MGIVTFAIIGLIVGSFLNVCIFRVPEGKSIVLPRSACRHCQHPIAPYDNIPIFSYIFLRGRCRHCKHPLSWQYPAVEAATALVWVWTAIVFRVDLHSSWPVSLSAALCSAFSSAMIVLAVIDARHRILPHGITFGGLFFSMALAPWQPFARGQVSSIQAAASFFSFPVPADWFAALIAAFIGLLSGGGLLLVVAVGYYLVKRREGMGHGDIAMMGFVGAFLGWRLTFLTIFMGSLLGVAAWFVISGRDREYELPFGTFLAAGAVLSMLFGNPLLDWYSGFLHV